MPFIDTVTGAIADAMRVHDAPRLSTLRMLKAALMNRAVEKKRDLDDGESLQVVQALVKQRKDSIEQFGAAGRDDLVVKEQAELAVLQTYLPERLSAEAIEAEVAAIVVELSAKGAGDMGKVMAAVKARLAGKADMGTVSGAVKKALAG